MESLIRDYTHWLNVLAAYATAKEDYQINDPDVLSFKKARSL
jgi:hypothetical protein